MSDWPPLRLKRKITGMSAILLPMLTNREVDWQGFRDHVLRTLQAGLIPAVNMDTGYANLIDESTRLSVLRETQSLCSGKQFVAGAMVLDRAGAEFNADAYRQQIDSIQQHQGVPVIFQSYGLVELQDAERLEAYRQLGQFADQYIGFELGSMFAPFGMIYSLDFYREWIQIPQCVAAKHSSLNRHLEWQRLDLRDQVRPEFRVLTGNDLAIDMVQYGSDYLLGLSTMAPDWFAHRDKLWELGDPEFYHWNDWLQYLGFFAFRSPTPAYKHTAAQFLNLRGWIATQLTYPGSPTRPDSDVEILKTLLQQCPR